jgi:Raf kinase inhibitor-like YbhB/YbcL family protein
MELTSTAFANNGAIPQKYSCQGEGVNPPLFWKGVPGKTKVMALVMDDPDAPSGTFDHWVVWNITPQAGGVGENSVPADGIQGNNGAGKPGWYPPCPPSGTHHYHFKLYALDAPVTLAQGSTKAELEEAMKNSIVAEAELVGTYAKQ